MGVFLCSAASALVKTSRNLTIPPPSESEEEEVDELDEEDEEEDNDPTPAPHRVGMPLEQKTPTRPKRASNGRREEPIDVDEMSDAPAPHMISEDSDEDADEVDDLL